MKKIHGLGIIIVFLALIPVQINAFCDIIKINNEKTNLKKLSANVNFSTTYVEDEAGLSFSIRISNLDKSLKLLDTTTKKEISYGLNPLNPREYVIDNYAPGQTIKFDFLAKNSECINENEVLIVKYVTLPHYNKYYKDSLCKGLENHLICRKWALSTLNYDQFKTEVAKLKFVEEREKEKEDEKEVKPIISLFEIIENYYPYLIPIIIIAGGFIIYRRSRNDFKL